MKTFKRILTYFRYRKGLFVLGLILQIISVGLNVYSPIIGQQFIDYLSINSSEGQVIDIGLLAQMLGLYLLIVGLGALVGYISYIILAYVANSLSKIVRDHAHEHMQQLPISYFDDKPAGKISARIVNDTEVLREAFFHNFSNQMLINASFVLAVYVAMFFISPIIGAVFLLMIPLLVVWQITYAKKIKPINTAWRESVSDMNSQTAEIVQGVSIVQLFNRQESMARDFASINDSWLDSRLKSIRLDAIFTWSLTDLLKNFALMGILAYIGSQYQAGIMGFSPGTLFVLINYVTRLFDPIANIVRLMSMLQQALVAGSRVFELIDHAVEKDNGRELQVTEGNVVFDGVNFAYKEGQSVLKDINISVKKGQTIGLVGHTGSGKSSIINLLFRFYDPQEGQILIDGKNIVDYGRESVRADMGIVLQEPYLFSGTIATNISMNDEAISEDMILDAIEKVGAKDLIAKFAKGIHEPVIEKGQTLSSGERQLVSFARTLASNPRILILDEATSHIDTQTEEVIQHAMNVVKEGRTTFIIAHRLSTIQNADQIILLDAGEIKERGKHEELMALGGQYAEMFQLQAKVTV